MMKNSLLLIGLVLSALSISAQYDFCLYNQSLAPHRYRVNPAFSPKATTFLGLPIMSNTSLNYGNNRFTYRDLIAKREGSDSIYFDINNFLSKPGDAGTISFGLNTDLLSFGFKVKKFDFNFSVSEMVQGRIRLRTDLFRLVVEGNAPSMGEEINPGDFAIRLEHYREHALGVSRSFGSKWRGGLRIKYLYGYEHADVERSTVSLTTDPVTFDLSGNSDILIRTAGLEPDAFDNFSAKNYLLGRKNRGWGLDLGVTYLVLPQLELSASALNLGRINWKDNVKTYANTVRPVTFSGIELNQFFGDGADNLDDKFQEELDSLTTDFTIQETEETYSKALLPVFFTAAKYSLGKTHHVLAAYRAEPYKKQVYSSFSLGYAKQFGSILELNTQWVYANRNAKNLGLGLVLNFGITNLSIASDNVLAALNPYDSRNINARVGLTMLTGYSEKSKRRRDQDQDGVRDSEDACPTEAGSVLLKGCPDKDSDGVADKDDICPLEPGLAVFKGCPDDDRDSVPNRFDKCPLDSGWVYLKGCPDKDLDSIADADDRCPELAGLAYFGGCPDADNDSIPDLEDDCPGDKGLKINRGCPDTDNDGIIDARDLCPDKPGTASQGGCPFVDGDGDGIKDDEDACPTKAGPISNKGCPYDDSDGDSVPDALDHCPTVAGVPENNGCPKLKEEEAVVLNAAFDNLEFETGKAVIKASSYKALNDLAKLLDERAGWKLIVTGHTDNVGSEKSNMTLSKARAASVKDFMTKAGIDASRIDTKWYGPNRPIADNTTTEGRQKNRRVELTIIQN